jgi:acetyltransferase
MNTNLEKLFNPKSIAIIGATDKEGKVGAVITKNISKLGYGGEIFLVNPSRKSGFFQKYYPDIQSIGKEIDLAIVAIPSKLVVEEIRKSSDAVKNFVVISAGFSEIGSDGKKREEELAKIAKEKNLNILGPNCLGFIIPKIKLNASFAGGMPAKGNIAFISQSGALAVALLDIVQREKIAFSGVVSIGNKMQLDESDVLEYFAQDEETKVIGLYLEGIKDGKKFMETAAKISQKKPIVILKAGKTEKSQKAISSHTGALAGSDEIMDAVFEKLGILRAKNLENFIDLLELISKNKIPENPEVIVITNAGGPGVLTTDSFKGKKIMMANFSDGTKEKFRTFLPEESSVENPVDLLGDAKEDRYKKALEIAASENADCVLCLLTPQDQTPVEKVAEKIVEFKEKTNKIVVAVFIGGERVEKAVEILQTNGVPNFFFPDQAVEALDKYYEWSQMMKKKINLEKIEINEERKKQVGEIIQKAKSENRSALLFGESKKIMDLYEINTSDFYKVETHGTFSPDINFPVVLKVDSDKVLHKTDQQGVVAGIKNEQELKTNIEKMKNNFPQSELIIQPMAEKGTELILGIKRDDIFGTVVVFGLGGIYTEIFKMVDFIISPADHGEIEEILLKSQIGFLFKESRGQKACEIKDLAPFLANLMSLAEENAEIKELDINPLFVYSKNRKSIAVDVKIIF